MTNGDLPPELGAEYSNLRRDRPPDHPHCPYGLTAAGFMLERCGITASTGMRGPCRQPGPRELRHR